MNTTIMETVKSALLQDRPVLVILQGQDEPDTYDVVNPASGTHSVVSRTSLMDSIETQMELYAIFTQE